jgi:hypothetical protein
MCSRIDGGRPRCVPQSGTVDAHSHRRFWQHDGEVCVAGDVPGFLEDYFALRVVLGVRFVRLFAVVVRDVRRFDTGLPALAFPARPDVVRVLGVVRRARFFTGTTTGGTDGSAEGMISVSPAATGFGVIASATARPALFNPFVTVCAAPVTASVVLSINFLSLPMACSFRISVFSTCVSLAPSCRRGAPPTGRSRSPACGS